MAIKRAHRAGQLVTLPLLSDPEYRERRAARIADAVIKAVVDLGAAASESAHKEARRNAEAEAGAAIDAEEELFRTTLDPAALRTDLTGVCRVTLRALPGADFAAADERAGIAAAPIEDAKARAVRYQGAYIMGVLERALVSSGVEGLPVVESGRFPLELLHGPGGIGAAWPSYSAEVFGLAFAWSHLGESAGSSCAPSSGEPT